MYLDVKKLRRDKGLTQEALADILGITQGQLSRVENGHLDFTARQIQVLESKYALDAYKASPGVNKGTEGYLADDATEYKSISAHAAQRPHSGFSQAQIRSLLASKAPKMQEGIYQMFRIEGISMYPRFSPGDEVLCRRVMLDDIINNHVYFIVSTNAQLQDYFKGVVLKRISYRKEAGYVTCKSDNNDSTEPYSTFRLDIDEVLEVWDPKLKLSYDFSDPNRDLYDRVDALETKMEDLERFLIDDMSKP